MVARWRHFGNYCQKSLFFKKFANFLAIIVNAKQLPVWKYQLSALTKESTLNYSSNENFQKKIIPTL